MTKILVATCLNRCEGKSTHGTNIKELEKYIYIYIYIKAGNPYT